MRIRQLWTALAALLLLGAAPAPPRKWTDMIADQNREWSQGPRALLKLQAEMAILEGQDVSVVGTPGDAASYHFLRGRREDGVLVATMQNGVLSATLHGETYYATALRQGIAVETGVDFDAHPLGAGPPGTALALYNQNSAAAANFKGVDYFPYDETYRVTATFRSDPAMTPRVFRVSQGADRPFYHDGDASFTLNGKSITLPFYSSSARNVTVMSAFFMDDLTGTEAYGAGRYVSVDDFGSFPPQTVTIDFNYAYNPVCARSPFFSCPVALDTIATAIRAGEKDSHLPH